MTPRGRLAGLVDATLEASVIGGFSRIGPALRGRVEHWADPPRLDGRVCLVTGASGGLGLAASLGLLAAPLPVQAQTDPLPSWNDGAAKQAIIDLVA